MSAAIVCASHTPLMYKGPASNETEQRVRTAFERLGSFVKEFAPDYIVQFAPDHFNGFFYDLMPSFCVGAGAVSLGDWGGGTGPLDVPEETALALIDHLRGEDFDVAVSYRMPVDHGFVQIWEAMLGDFRSIPMLPIFINGAAPPVPTYRRARQLGESVGRFAARSGKRVLFAASGGLSHDPPLPSIRDAAPELRERLISGRNPSPEARKAREERVYEAGVLAEAGKGPCKPLNPEWDAEFMDLLRSGQIWRADGLNTETVRDVAGRGANEVLSWVAAFAALSMAGQFTMEQEFYEAIPGWIAGLAMMAAKQAEPAH
ncbi:3-carboxyethylcatechol 2,3-dioxygenase [Bradyrhizobium sp. DOA9]|uniref:3-carboxyethylcatechol 2,3-dioxygenase n=1 Tax=Bradyrhizobium sp. DOA9 TaxID=1126627 RepID=UPI000469CA49|nr:3-carboxyethylcatechol 2,3-dioxygenase [Bradyrhizobium sp. DOA9]GAJ35313.1 metapyrocatechase 1 [Bradyrhizobium sp. DOA9]